MGIGLAMRKPSFWRGEDVSPVSSRTCSKQGVLHHERKTPSQQSSPHREG